MTNIRYGLVLTLFYQLSMQVYTRGDHTQQVVIIIIIVIIVHLVCESHFLGSKCRMTFIKQAENVELTLMSLFTLFAC